VTLRRLVLTLAAMAVMAGSATAGAYVSDKYNPAVVTLDTVVFEDRSERSVVRFVIPHGANQVRATPLRRSGRIVAFTVNYCRTGGTCR